MADPTAPARTPDVIVILADDLGFSDLGCFGGEIPTPNLDRLAAAGRRLSNFYTTPRCSPTRASLVTGRYSHDVGIGVLTREVGYRGSLDPDVPTIATTLADEGYRTALFGKWHLAADVRQPSASWPTRRGFGTFYGILGGGTSYFAPRAFFDGETEIDSATLPADFYLTDEITDRACAFADTAIVDGDPYLVYLSYTAPHWPLHAPDADVAARAGDYADGWDAARAARVERLGELGILHDVEPSARDAQEPAWTDVSDAQWQQRRMEVYAAQVVAMDRGVGRVLDLLEARGTLDDTIILFFSDNGAEAEEIDPGRRYAPHVMPTQTKQGEPVRFGNIPEVTPGAEDTFASYGRAWANLSNTPFRRYKKWTHEGGIASPLIAHWPAGGVAGGDVLHSPMHVIDVLPTVARAAGAIAPHVHGTDMLDVLNGDDASNDADRTLFWEHIGHAAARRGRWKLVRERDEAWELYDLAVDRAETRDVAADHPELVDELARAWKTWADSHGVIPWPALVDTFAEAGLPAWQAQS